MKRFKNPLFDIFMVIIVIIIGGILALQYHTVLSILQNDASNQSSQQNYPVIPETVASASTKNQVRSPDGTMTLIMQTETKQNGSKTYSFITMDSSGKNEHAIFSKTIAAGDMVLPDNSWAPDNKYVFIQDEESNTTSILVFKASGEAFANGQQYLDVTSLFAQRITQYTFKEATGWAGFGLLIVSTTASDGTQGPSYWFEVGSQGFIRLAGH